MTVNTEQVIYKIPVTHWLILLSIGLMVIYPFYEPLSFMVKIWFDREEYSHGFFIPVLACFFIYQNRDVLHKKEFKGSWIGFAITIVGLSIGVIGEITTIYIVVQYAFIIILFGVLYSYLGYNAFKHIWVALLILVFMIPLPEFIYINLSQKLQLLSSYLGVLVIRFLDISVYLEGNVIDLGNYKLQVVEACSGLRYLFPLMCFGFICAYIFKAPFWQRCIVFFTTVPITVLMNSFRIGVIGILVNYWGIEHAEGFLHDFEGWIVFMACVGILFLEMWLFTVFFQKKTSLSEVFVIYLPEPISERVERIDRHHVKQLFALLPVCLVAIVINFQMQSRELIIPNREEFVSYPDNIEDWQGKRSSLEQIYINALTGLSDYIISDYYNSDGQHVNLYAAYYANQSSVGSIHTPRNCIPGGGWKINNLTQIKVDADVNGEQKIKVNRVLITLGDHKNLVYYWFYQIGRELADEFLLKWFMFYDSIAKNRNDGSLLRLTTTIKTGEDEALADKRLQDFLKKSYPLFKSHLPE